MNTLKHGARYCRASNATVFRVWAPFAESVELHLSIRGEADWEQHALEPAERGYWRTTVADCPPGSQYKYSVDGKHPRPDPASLQQPNNDVHGPSAVVDPHFDWTDHGWAGPPLDEYIVYEFHVGTFTAEGTFEAAIKELPRLKKLGITAVEVMPIAQFPGTRNWGYDGVYLYAAVEAYGGLRGFQRFVDAAHAVGLAVILDVVYNHLGPEGNYLAEFGPYFNDCYHTPWGSALNFDAAHRDGVRDFFIGNAVFWIQECHVDALRLDAVHAIIDSSAVTFLEQLCTRVHNLARQLHRRVYVIAENDRNDPRCALPPDRGGIGADSQWNDDFHHALHAVLTGENHGYYEDFGRVTQLAKAYTDGYVYDGVYSNFRKKHHGADSRPLEGVRFVVFSQNHDQIGNRPDGARLSTLLEFPQLKVSAVAVMVSPFIPLLFMGEEVGAHNPFLYFESHGDEELIKNVQEGRAKEFHAFFTRGEPIDPHSEEAFTRSKIPEEISPIGAAMTRLYTRLAHMRQTIPALSTLNKRRTRAWAHDARKILIVRREENASVLLAFFNFSDREQKVKDQAESGNWKMLLHTEDASYLGPLQTEETMLESTGELAIMLPAQSCAVMLHCGSSPQIPPGNCTFI